MNQIHINPDYLRLPRSGSQDPCYGLTRSTWNELILPCAANDYDPPITSIVLKKKGAVRGIRLISHESARDYFKRLGEEQRRAVSGQKLDMRGEGGR